MEAELALSFQVVAQAAPTLVKKKKITCEGVSGSSPQPLRLFALLNAL